MGKVVYWYLKPVLTVHHIYLLWPAHARFVPWKSIDTYGLQNKEIILPVYRDGNYRLSAYPGQVKIEVDR